MSQRVIEVVDAGLLTTVQDRGRYGFQRFGVPVSGAMDTFSLRAANLLVGNDHGAACLEMTVIGPRLRFVHEALVAVTGGDLALRVDGRPMPRWQAVRVAQGSVLSSDGMTDGMRAYLAVAGGIDVPKVMGSRSTHMSSRIGGLDGRALRAGDQIRVDVDGIPDQDQRALPEDLEPVHYGHSHVIRAVLGPQADAFSPDAIETLFDSRYLVSIDSDRVGYRLEGPHLRHESGADIISDGSPAGAIQVPANGMPIVLMADRGPTGGYAKIGTVISADLGRLAQARPGDAVTFRQVTGDQAVEALIEQEAILHTLDPSLVAAAPEPVVRAIRTAAGLDRPRREKRVVRTAIGGETVEVEILIEHG